MHFPEVAVEPRRTDHGIAVGELLELGKRSEDALAVDDERPLVAVERKLDLVAPGLRQLDDAEPVPRDRPLRRALANSHGAIGTLDLTFDRLGERTEVPVAFLDQQRAVVQRHEGHAAALDVDGVGGDYGVVCALARDTVDAGLADDASERRPGGSRLDEPAFFHQPLVQRLRAAEESHASLAAL